MNRNKTNPRLTNGKSKPACKRTDSSLVKKKPSGGLVFKSICAKKRNKGRSHQ